MTIFHDTPNIYPRDVVLKVVDLKRSLEFYQKTMGLRVLEEKENKYVLTADGTAPLVTIMTSEGIKPKTPRRSGLYHFAVLLPDKLFLGLFLKNILDQQYPLTGGAHHGVSDAIYLQDPDDNGIEIYADTAPDTWETDDESINMVTKRLDYAELIALAEGRSWEGAPEGTVLGHMHLHVGDLEKAYEFYTTLGFDLTQRMMHQAYFVSTGGYHHHIAFNIWNGRNAEPLPESSAGMKYFTLKFPSKDVLDKCISRLEAEGFSVTKDSGDVYAKDPSGNLIKFIL